MYAQDFLRNYRLAQAVPDAAETLDQVTLCARYPATTPASVLETWLATHEFERQAEMVDERFGFHTVPESRTSYTFSLLVFFFALDEALEKRLQKNCDFISMLVRWRTVRIAP